MELERHLTEAIGVLRRDTTSILAVAGDTGALLPGLTFIALAAFLSNLPSGFFLAIVSLVGAPILSFLVVGIVFGLTRLFKGNGDYMSLWRPIAYSYLLGTVGILGYVPVLGVLVGLATSVYLLIVQVVIVETTQQIGRGKAIAVALIPALFWILIVMVFLVIFSFFMTENSDVAPFIYELF